MVLVDTSVWISRLRDGNNNLEGLLNKGTVLCHPFIIGELAYGSIRNRNEILSLLGSLPSVEILEHDEVLGFLEDRNLISKGLGYIDIHLLASAIISDSLIRSLDRTLNETAVELNIYLNLNKYLLGTHRLSYFNRLWLFFTACMFLCLVHESFQPGFSSPLFKTVKS